MAVLSGNITSNSISLDGSIEDLSTVLVGEIASGEFREHYSGLYVVNPKVTLQTLETDDLIMDDDVTVNAIHYSETLNQYGGYTVQIGEI